MTKIEDFVFNSLNSLPKKSKITCEAPSNIALVKYWGKYGEQLPKNTSISFTLSSCKTTTTLKFEQLEEATTDFEFEVFLNGNEAPAFKPKIAKFFERIVQYVPYIRAFRFEIHTTNTFPHSSGIASSASGFAALAACVVNLEKQIDSSASAEYYLQKTSFLARLGSGSAARSTEGPMMLWGDHNDLENSSNFYAVPYTKINPIFETYQDTILLVSQGEKSVGSTAGHQLMHTNPFASQRFGQAQEHILKLNQALKDGDLDVFIELVELEALTLHAMMMTSTPYYILMKPNTLAVIDKVWAYRKETGSKLCFTLDAGANVHLLYPEREKQDVQDWIEKELKSLCEQGKYIHDQVGSGVQIIID